MFSTNHPHYEGPHVQRTQAVKSGFMSLVLDLKSQYGIMREYRITWRISFLRLEVSVCKKKPIIKARPVVTTACLLEGGKKKKKEHSSNTSNSSSAANFIHK
jgi:hypothetical protein